MTYHALAPAERLHSWCEAGEAEECINAGYAWLHVEVVPNLGKALIAFHKGCEMGDSHACLLSRYLRKRYGLTELGHESVASYVLTPDATWYDVLPDVTGLADPTAFKGRYTRKDPPNYIDVGTWFRVGIAPSIPMYTSVMAEADFSGMSVSGPAPPLGPLAVLGVTHLTAGIERIDRQGMYRLHSFDVTFGIGYAVRPWNPTPLEVRMGVLFDFSVVTNSDRYSGLGLGAWGGLAYRVGRHRFEAGSFISGVPVREEWTTHTPKPELGISFDAAAMPYLRYTYLRSW